MSEEIRGEMVPFNGGETSLMVQVTGLKKALETSLDLETDRGKLCYAAAMGEPDYAGKNAVGEELVITDYLVHLYSIEDEKTGEITRRLRLCLFTTDDKVFAFSGRICLESFAMLVAIWGLPPWKQGMRVKVVAAGRGYKMVPVVNRSESPKQKAK